MAIKYCLNVDFSIQEVRFQPSLCAHSHSPNPSLSSPLSPSTSFHCAVSCVSTYCCPKNVQWTTCHWLLPTSCKQQKLYLTQMIRWPRKALPRGGTCCWVGTKICVESWESGGGKLSKTACRRTHAARTCWRSCSNEGLCFQSITKLIYTMPVYKT